MFMKYLLPLLIATLFVISSCKKHHDDGVDFGCIEQLFIKAKEHAISSTDVATVDNLLSKTTIDNSKLIYSEFTHDTLQDDYAPYTKHDRKIVYANYYERGITIFNIPQVFVFLDDTLSVRNSTIRNVSARLSGLSTTPNSSLPRVRKLFRDYLEWKFPFDNNSNRIDYTDTCFEAEFGWYIEIVGLRGDAIKYSPFWRVFKKNSSNSPVAYFNDKTGQQTSYYSYSF